MSLVVDANIVVKWFVEEIGSDEARKLLSRPGELFAPAHALAEIGHVLVRYRRGGSIGPSQFEELKTVVPGIVTLVPTDILFGTAIEIALETDITVYDSLYVAAAAARQFPFVTADERLMRSLSGTRYAPTAVLLGSQPIP